MLPEFADVSVITPAYNNAATVARALASIAAQTVPPREVIVVDDGSIDDTAEVVRAMVPRMNGVRLRLFRQQNNGAGAARNQALAAASGTWLAFLDADDEWLPIKLERSLAMVESGLYDMIAHDVVVIDGGEERVVDCFSRWRTNPSDPFRSLFQRGFISSSTVLLRRSVAVAVGGFDPDLRSAQDYELWLAVLAKIGARFQVFPESLLRYYVAPQGITSHIDRKVRCSIAILLRHMGNLKSLPGPVLKPLFMRLAAIHLEAIRGHRQQGAVGKAAGCLVSLPFTCLRVLAALPVACYQRPNFLAALPVAEELPLELRS